MSKKENLIWIDLEMTGLDPEADRIIEIATIVTDPQLNLIAEGPVMAVRQSTSLIEGMDEWCTRTHGASGLTRRVLDSTISEAEAEQKTLDFLRLHTEPNSSPICGNTIGQDRRFLERYMPELENYFHYRYLDVSTLKELARRWKPEILAGVKKQGTHLALDDIRDSIEELRYYREHFLKLD
ncbi:oligoribonuclease [Aestuariirhabdus sp. Z084]|uniref:oligoribonuclease n=1 Tax=Aestuariirhabdus haliotis TaxID=2918751 RepID=UPI00201B3F9E|nr:oligoribonuclease [Aestuariirhabdus haliotis]MCL6415630.1 oligoribonuclease [Aestuariirhabdus haliotis]MCL6419625.1 oligoribonuclease [Aestuariirhabdus haliotis]